MLENDDEISETDIKKAIETKVSSWDKSVYRNEPIKMQYCTKCLYPASSASPLVFVENGVCTGCFEKGKSTDNTDWNRLERIFARTLDQYRIQDGSNYDCIIPVSGGKDSYYQVYLLKNVYKMNPLLVTYNANNYSETGMKNLKNMRNVFGCDHIFFTPSIRVIKAMNRLGMLMMGDMNWHAHSGIMTYPFQVAVEKKIPLVFYGEHGMMDLAGMHSQKDMIEFTYRYRKEHQLRGYEWYDFIRESKKYNENLERSDMIPWVFPSDKDMERVGVRGLYISNYFPWSGNYNFEVSKKLGFKEPKEDFERTYRKMSNLDDMHENGIHDYMKYIKFGYGRASDHCCKDIREGRMSREEGIEIVRQMDHVKSRDLYRWLNYVGWTEDQFDMVANTFRDKRVWYKDKNEWIKDNLWD